LTEVAPQSKSGKRLLDHLANANKDANPELMRFALKLATGAGKTTVMASSRGLSRSSERALAQPRTTSSDALRCAAPAFPLTACSF
jgi:hypothetical protein